KAARGCFVRRSLKLAEFDLLLNDEPKVVASKKYHWKPSPSFAVKNDAILLKLKIMIRDQAQAAMGYIALMIGSDNEGTNFALDVVSYGVAARVNSVHFVMPEHSSHLKES